MRQRIKAIEAACRVIDESRDLGAAPSSMDSQDAAFWGFGTRVLQKFAEDDEVDSWPDFRDF